MKKNKYWFWILLTIPFVWLIVGYLRDSISYGEVIHQTGDWSVGLLFATLTVTPLRKLFPRSALSKWLMFHRRALGVASFAYAAFHTLTYLERKWGYGYIVPEGLELPLLTGWVALAIFLILAVTSNNKSIRLLRNNWQRLHRTVYIATALTFAHWILAAYEPPPSAYIVLALLCIIESFRLFRIKK